MLRGGPEVRRRRRGAACGGVGLRRTDDEEGEGHHERPGGHLERAVEYLRVGVLAEDLEHAHDAQQAQQAAEHGQALGAFLQDGIEDELQVEGRDAEQVNPPEDRRREFSHARRADGAQHQLDCEEHGEADVGDVILGECARLGIFLPGRRIPLYTRHSLRAECARLQHDNHHLQQDHQSTGDRIHHRGARGARLLEDEVQPHPPVRLLLLLCVLHPRVVPGRRIIKICATARRAGGAGGEVGVAVAAPHRATGAGSRSCRRRCCCGRTTSISRRDGSGSAAATTLTVALMPGSSRSPCEFGPTVLGVKPPANFASLVKRQPTSLTAQRLVVRTVR